MTVAELIALLSEMPQDHNVLVTGYEGGCHDAGPPKVVMVERNVHTERYYGPHEVQTFPEDSEGGDITPHVLVE